MQYVIIWCENHSTIILMFDTIIWATVILMLSLLISATFCHFLLCHFIIFIVVLCHYGINPNVSVIFQLLKISAATHSFPPKQCNLRISAVYYCHKTRTWSCLDWILMQFVLCFRMCCMCKWTPEFQSMNLW